MPPPPSQPRGASPLELELTRTGRPLDRRRPGAAAGQPATQLLGPFASCRWLPRIIQRYYHCVVLSTYRILQPGPPPPAGYQGWQGSLGARGAGAKTSARGGARGAAKKKTGRYMEA